MLFRSQTELLKEDFTKFYHNIKENRIFAHGEFQYHNVMYVGTQIGVINFDKCQCDSRVRDISLILRKTLEKTNWSLELGKLLMDQYESITPLTSDEKKQLFYRLAYPEKFWKILNFYYNSNKAFVSSQYSDKLEMLLLQENQKEEFLQKLFL